MKLTTAILLLIASTVYNTSLAAKPTTAINNNAWHVASESGMITIENKSAEPLDVLITDRQGHLVESFTMQKGKKKLSIKELHQGNYNIKLRSQEKQKNIKLQIL